jgi:hypothetical protein
MLKLESAGISDVMSTAMVEASAAAKSDARATPANGTPAADLSNSLAGKGLMRHSSVSTTERHYIKDVPESTLHGMKLLGTLCNPRATGEEGKPI